MRFIGLGVAALAALCSAGAGAAETGTAVVLVGACDGSLVNSFTLQMHNQGNTERAFASIPKAMFSFKDNVVPVTGWKDDTGNYIVYRIALSPGEWAIYNHVVASRTTQYFSRNDYAWRFPVKAGAVTYLGRYCAGSQKVVVEMGFGLKNIEMGQHYIIVSGKPEVDLKNAAVEATEVINAVPTNPGAFNGTYRTTHLEPREIRRAPPKGPCVSTDPVNPCQ